jgi:hypothetical protein
MATEYIWTFETKNNGVVEVSTKQKNIGIAIVELAIACSGRTDLNYGSKRAALRQMGNKIMKKLLGVRLMGAGSS